MTSIYLINLGEYNTSLSTTLQSLRRSPQKDQKVVLRIAESSERLHYLNAIHTRKNPSRRTHEEGDNREYSDFSSMNQFQTACIELLKSVSDVDIRLPMGYTIFEVPTDAKTIDDVEIDCFLTFEELCNYLASANASPYDDKSDPEEPWKGEESIVPEAPPAPTASPKRQQRYEKHEEITPDQVAERLARMPTPATRQSTTPWLQSTMVFKTEFRLVETTIQKAIDYLEGELTSRSSRGVLRNQRKLEILATSDSMKAKVYVIPNISCEFSIIKENQYFTNPVTKQRLLYIYDTIHAWLQSHLKKWVEIRRETKPLRPESGLSCFQYRVEKMAVGFNAGPALAITPELIVKDFSLSTTEAWYRFMDNGGNPTLEQKMAAVVSFINSHGIDMVVEGFSGPVEDYVPDRASFVLPAREEEVKVVPQEPKPEHRGRMGSRGRGYGRHQQSGAAAAAAAAGGEGPQPVTEIVRYHNVNRNRGRGGIAVPPPNSASRGRGAARK